MKRNTLVWTKAVLLVCIFTALVAGVSGLSPESSVTTDYRFTDTVQERVNATNYDDGTLLSWNWTDGAQTYMFDIGRVTTDYTYHSDGTVKDVEITAELEPNNLTRLLDASKEP